MRSESDGHCLPTSFPGLAVRCGLAPARVRPLVESVCDRYHPTVEEFLDHVEELRARSGWERARRADAAWSGSRAVDGGFALDGTARSVTSSSRPGHPGLATSRRSSRDDPRVVHAYEPHEYADDVAVVGAGLAAATEWLNALAAGARVDLGAAAGAGAAAAQRAPPLLSQAAASRAFHAAEPAARVRLLQDAARPVVSARRRLGRADRARAGEGGSASRPR